MTTRKTVSAPRISAEQKRYQAQDDLRTIQRATEIQSDKKRMGAAQKEAQTQMAALGSITKRK